MNVGSKAKSNKNEVKDHGDVFKVDNVRYMDGKDGKHGIAFFTLIYHDMKIYSCKVVTGKNGDFIAFPSSKGSDGKYYNSAWMELSEDDTKSIIKMVEDALA